MKTDNVIEKIHNEFDNSTELLLTIVKEHKENLNCLSDKDKKLLNYNKSLTQLGFNNSKIVQKSLKLLELSNKNQEAKNFYNSLTTEIERFKKSFPFHKFILYNQLEIILEKYNLYLGHSSLYKGDIPEKNLKELLSFNDKYSNAIYSFNIKYTETEPIAGNISKNASNHSHNGTYYICAPKKEFINDVNTFKREVYKPKDKLWASRSEVAEYLRQKRLIEDPIILLPVKLDNISSVGFIVVTKWGLEANEPSLTQDVLN